MPPPRDKDSRPQNGLSAIRDLENTAIKMRAFERFPIAFVLTNPNLDDNPIVYVNRAFEILTGYAADAAIGRNCRFLQGEDTSRRKIAELSEAISTRTPIETTITNYRADGAPFLNRLRIEPVFNDDGSLCCFLGLQRRVENDAAADPVREQLAEIQHRVKNHLQMIVSMIRLQSERAMDAAGEDYRTLAHRVETLQLLYQEMGNELPSANTSTTVPMGAYVSRIASAIGHLEGRENVRLNIRTESFDVSVDTAARVGLVASEVITNAFQHAFPEGRAGLVEVTLNQLSSGVMRLQISDDGIGLPDHIRWPNTNSMGGSIVKTLIDGINAKLSVVGGVTGTGVIIDIPSFGETNSSAN